MGTSRIDIVNIFDDSDDLQELGSGYGVEKPPQSMPKFTSTNIVNIEIDDKLKEKESECHESILHFILSSHNKYKLLEKMILPSNIACVDKIHNNLMEIMFLNYHLQVQINQWKEWSKNMTAMFG